MENSIISRLIKLRKAGKHSQNEVSEMLGVSRQAVSKWERGETSPGLENYIALAGVYNTTLDEILLGNKSEYTERPSSFKDIPLTQKLSVLRKENKLSQGDVAEKLGVSRQAVSKWERGQTMPDIDNLILLAGLYRTSLDDILTIKSLSSLSVPELINDLTPPEINAQSDEIPQNDEETLPFIDADPRMSNIPLTDEKTESEDKKDNENEKPIEITFGKTKKSAGYTGRIKSSAEYNSNTRASIVAFAALIPTTIAYICIGAKKKKWKEALPLFLAVPICAAITKAIYNNK